MPETIPLHVLYSCTDFDRNCQDGSIYTLLTAARIIKSKLYLCIKHHLCLTLPLFFPPVPFLFSPFFLSCFLPHIWVSGSWPQIISVYIISPLPVEIHTSDLFSIQYPQAMFRRLINQITVTQKPKNALGPKKANRWYPVECACMPSRMCVGVGVCVCVFPEVRDHLLILVRRENMFSREEVTYDWTPRLEHTCKGLSGNLSTHTPPMHVPNTSRYSWCSCLIAHDWLGVGWGWGGQRMKARGGQKERKNWKIRRDRGGRAERLLQLIRASIQRGIHLVIPAAKGCNGVRGRREGVVLRNR